MCALQGETERFQSVTMELTGYTPPKVLVIRSEVTRTICQVIFHMMMWVQDSKNSMWLRMDFAFTYICTYVLHTYVHQLVNEIHNLSL